jgi:uncharacterized protein YbjT (DUF2867 family)
MILVAGAAGFLGRSLVGALRARGRPVRALVRSLDEHHRFDPSIDVALGDVLEPESLIPALEGVSAVYYLVHAMGRQARGGEPLEALERRGIDHLIDACRRAGVRRVIYQGGLSEAPDAGSTHLRARWQVEAALEASGLDHTVFRSGMIVGRGSLSFEVLYRVVRDLPVIPLLRWSGRTIEPIALSDLLELLVGCLDEPRTIGRSFDVGNGEPRTYAALGRQMAELLDRHPLFVPLPVDAPRLTALGIVAATHAPLRLASYLAPSLRLSLVHEEHRIDAIFPGPRRSFREAAEEALRRPEVIDPPLWQPTALLHLLRRSLRPPGVLQAPRALPDAARRLGADLQLLWEPP